MKTLLLKSIFFCLLSSIFCLQTHAQIVYTDINPDTVLNGSTLETYPLDLNNDGITDFDLSHSYSHFSYSSGTLCYYYHTLNYFSAYPKNLNAIASDSIGGVSLSSPTTINGGLTWRDTTSNHGYNNLAGYSYYSAKHCPPSPASSSSSGHWLNQSDKYLGLKIIKNGLTYYGWVRLTTVSATTITVKDYAYNATPNQPILAGEGTSFAAISPIAGSTFCAGGSIIIPFTVQGNFSATNIFTAELSNEAGSFSPGVAIGNITGNSAGNINAVIPSNILYGFGYRVRIVSTNPVKTSSDNGVNLIINTAISATITSGTNPGCGNVTVYAPTANGNIFQWQLNGINIANAISYYYSAGASGNYLCNISNVCGNVSSNTMAITVNPYPTATATPAGPTEVCPGSSVLFNANTGSGLNYQWLKSSVVISGATNSSYMADSSGYYSVKVTNGYGCSKTSLSYTVQVQKPSASIYNSRPLTFCNGDSTVLSTINNPLFTYQWKKNGTNISGATAFNYTATTSGKYKVKVSNPNVGCDSISKAKTVTVNCRLENSNSPEETESLFVYPNPATNTVNIKFPSDSNRDDESGEIQIVNLFGQIVFSEKLIPITNRTEQTQIDVSQFSEGMYVVRWRNGAYSETKTLSLIK